jgi:FAD dependent oxidoreductase TIGR03364
MGDKGFDLVVVGAGVLGLAHALAAVRRRLKVCVVERNAPVSGASIRNFGLVVVSGQQAGECRARAERTRELWEQLASEAGIDIVHRGMLVAAQRPEAVAVLEAFARGEMGRGCTLYDAAEARRRWPFLRGALVGALWSPHELRMESRTAIPRFAHYLAETHGVIFRQALVTAVEGGAVITGEGRISGKRVIVTPGDDLVTLFPERLRALGVTRCKLQMLRIADPTLAALPCAVISDLSLARYEGFCALPGADALAARLRQEQPRQLENGVHLIVVRSEDGSLVLGDSHQYGPAPHPFGSASIDDLILGEYRTLFGHAPAEVSERWIGTYASAPGRLMLVDRPDPTIRLVLVTSGTGASTGLAIGEEVVADLFG